MKKLLPLLYGCFLITTISTNTYANSEKSITVFQKENTGYNDLVGTNNSSGLTTETTFDLKNNTKPNSKANRVSGSKLFKKNDLVPEPFNGFVVQMPESFEPNAEYGHLFDVEVLGVAKLDIKIYNNWGVLVAESSIKHKKTKNESLKPIPKKLSLTYKAVNNLNSNQELVEGDYHYQIEVYSLSGDKMTKEGDIKLMRTQRK